MREVLSGFLIATEEDQRKKRYEEAQIAIVMRQATTDAPLADIVRKKGVGDQPLFGVGALGQFWMDRKWKKKAR